MKENNDSKIEFMEALMMLSMMIEPDDDMSLKTPQKGYTPKMANQIIKAILESNEDTTIDDKYIQDIVSKCISKKKI